MAGEMVSPVPEDVLELVLLELLEPASVPPPPPPPQATKSAIELQVIALLNEVFSGMVVFLGYSLRFNKS
jgi:hypothetical protein